MQLDPSWLYMPNWNYPKTANWPCSRHARMQSSPDVVVLVVWDTLTIQRRDVRSWTCLILKTVTVCCQRTAFNLGTAFFFLLLRHNHPCCADLCWGHIWRREPCGPPQSPEPLGLRSCSPYSTQRCPCGFAHQSLCGLPKQVSSVVWSLLVSRTVGPGNSNNVVSCLSHWKCTVNFWVSHSSVLLKGELGCFLKNWYSCGTGSFPDKV